MRRFFECVTSPERIATVTGATAATWNVIDDLADSIESTGSWTGILALVPYAGSVELAIRVDETLGTAVFVRVPVEVGQTGAEG